MKRLVSVGSVLLIICSAVIPVTAILDIFLTSASVKLTHPWFFVIAQFLLVTALALAVWRRGASLGEKLAKALARSLTVATLNVFFICRDIMVLCFSRRTSVYILLGLPLFIYIVLYIYMVNSLTKKGIARTFHKILSGIIAVASLPIFYILFIASVFIFSEKDTTLETVYAPNGVRYAEVVDSNQGALGGNTFVEVYDYKYETFLITVTDKPTTVYSGEWSERPTVKWISEGKISIDGVEYEV